MSEPPPYDKSSYGQGFNVTGQGQGYGVPGQGYTSPGQGQVYGAPLQGFVAPVQGYGAPVQGYGAPGQGHGASGQGVTAPVESHVMYVASPSFGEGSVTTVCRNCQANVSCFFWHQHAADHEN